MENKPRSIADIRELVQRGIMLSPETAQVLLAEIHELERQVDMLFQALSDKVEEKVGRP